MAAIIDGGGIGGDMTEAIEHLNRIIDGATKIANRNRVLRETYHYLDGKESLTDDDIHDIMAKIEEVIDVSPGEE